MDGDINYDSFGFTVIGLMHARRGLPRAGRNPARFLDYRHKCSLMPVPLSLSLFLFPSVSHFHSTHLVSLINFVLRSTIQHSSPSTRFHPGDCPLSRSPPPPLCLSLYLRGRVSPPSLSDTSVFRLFFLLDS